MALSDLPLLNQSHIVYKGSYRVPQTLHPSETHSSPIATAGGSCVYNPANNSLIMCGNEAPVVSDSNFAPFCEIALPSAAPVISSNKADLPQCTWVGPSKNICGLITPIEATWNSGNGQRIGSMTIDGSRLVVGTYLFYDGGEPSTRPSHFSIPLDIQTANSGNVKQMRRMSGTYPISTGGSAALGGGCFSLYSTTVPSEWQTHAQFSGVTHLCGCSQISVVSRAGICPVAWSFNPGYFSLADNDPIVSSPQVSNMFLHQYSSDISWNFGGDGNGTNMYDGLPGLPFNATSHTFGMTAVPGTRTIVYTGRNGTGYQYYGGGDENVKTIGPSGETLPPAKFVHGVQDDKMTGRGPHSVLYPAGFRKLPASPEAYDDQGSPNNHGVYSQYMWLYDALDFARVRAGTLHPRNLFPYLSFATPTPQEHVSSETSGGAWDPVGRRLFVIAKNGADIVGFAYYPVIHVYEVASLTSNPPTIVGNAGEVTRFGAVR